MVSGGNAVPSSAGGDDGFLDDLKRMAEWVECPNCNGHGVLKCGQSTCGGKRNAKKHSHLCLICMGVGKCIDYKLTCEMLRLELARVNARYRQLIAEYTLLEAQSGK